MEATTLQKKKNTISKGKMKKTIKNVLGRPDQAFWPEINEDQGKRLGTALQQYKINTPEFKKLKWKELKLIPREQRPKPPKRRKVDGLFFGINECSTAVNNAECAAIIIEASVNPRTIVQPVIELCTAKEVPVLCLTDLRKNSSAYFGIPTSCLGVQCGYLLDLQKEIIEIAKNYEQPKHSFLQENNINIKEEKMDTDDVIDKKGITTMKTINKFPLLYRTNKKTRVFVPSSEGKVSKTTNKFVGQDFIEFSEKMPQKLDRKAYMKMVMKRISNNPNRVKKK